MISLPCCWHFVINCAIAKVYWPLQPSRVGATKALPTLITALLKFILSPVFDAYLSMQETE